jgi:hypothetical protein
MNQPLFGLSKYPIQYKMTVLLHPFSMAQTPKLNLNQLNRAVFDIGGVTD